jgi:hypothetical protein
MSFLNQSSRLNAQFGNASVFRKETSTVHYQDNLRSKDLRLIAPVQVTQLPVRTVHRSNNLAKKFQYTFEVTLEKFTRMSEIYLMLEGNLRAAPTTTSTFVGAFLPQNRLLAPAFTLAQNFDNVEIMINNVAVTNPQPWCVMPGFLNTCEKNLVGLLHRPGQPFQRLIQEGALGTAVTTRYMASDIDFDNTGTTLSTVQQTLQKMLVPISTFSNLFAQPGILPPGTKLSFKATYQNCENWSAIVNTPPGITWVQATPPDLTAVQNWVFDTQTIHMQMTYYNISSSLEKVFMEQWKTQPWVVRYFKTELMQFPTLQFRPTGGVPTVGQTITDRLEIDSPANSCLLICLALPKSAPDGYDTYPQAVYGGNQFCAYAYPVPSTTSTGNRLKMFPFKFDYLKIFLEDNAEPIVDFTNLYSNGDLIHKFLKDETNKFFRINEHQCVTNTSDIYGYRVAPFFLPLHSEKYFNPNFGPIPKRASYLISYQISSIEGTQINANFEVYFHIVRSSTLQIDSRLNTLVYDGPLEFNGDNIEDISKN